jgi:hypothetical protein
MAVLAAVLAAVLRQLASIWPESRPWPLAWGVIKHLLQPLAHLGLGVEVVGFACIGVVEVPTDLSGLSIGTVPNPPFQISQESSVKGIPQLAQPGASWLGGWVKGQSGHGLI